MREILFRGFTPDKNGKDKAFVNGEWIKGQWVQGSYWKLNKTTYCFKEDYERDPNNTEHYIVFDQMTDWGLPNRHLQADVLPETVGQYTGLTDKNGKKIFEGDILKYKYVSNFSESEELEEVGNENPDRVMECNGVVKWIEKGGCFSPVPERYDCDDCWYSFGTYDFEVIGNIHDNPELVKGGKEK